jgi:hypothetical protein
MAGGRSKWRFFVDCSTCGAKIIIGDAPSPDEVEHPTHRGIEIACPQCRTHQTYRGAEVQRGEIEDDDE